MRRTTYVRAASRSFAFLFGGIWLLVGAPFLVIGLYTAWDTFRLQERFRTEAETAEGMVLTKAITRKKDSRTFHVGYRFPSPDGTTIRTHAQVSGALWDTLVEREPVRVTYLRSDPRINRLEGAGSDWWLPGIFTFFGLVFAPIGGVVFFRGARGIARQLRLETEGTRADATVLEVAPSNMHVNGVQQWQIRYRYQDHRGRKHVATSEVMPPEEAEAWKAGDTAAIRYDRHTPKHSVWIGRA